MRPWLTFAFLVSLIATSLSLTACGSDEPSAVDCGEGGEFRELSVGRYCAYGVVEGGFSCPAQLPFRFEFAGLRDGLRRGRDRFAKRVGYRSVDWAELRNLSFTVIGSGSAVLKWLDLRGDGCVRLGAPTDAVRARHHAAGRALGRSIHARHPDIDGILFPGRLTGFDV
jgi:hypothetical protein